MMQIKENSFKIIVKPNSPKNGVLGYDNNRRAYRIAVKAKPENNRANMEIVRFLSRLLKKRGRVVKGVRSREKWIRSE